HERNERRLAAVHLALEAARLLTGQHLAKPFDNAHAHPRRHHGPSRALSSGSYADRCTGRSVRSAHSAYAQAMIGEVDTAAPRRSNVPTPPNTVEPVPAAASFTGPWLRCRTRIAATASFSCPAACPSAAPSALSTSRPSICSGSTSSDDGAPLDR